MNKPLRFAIPAFAFTSLVAALPAQAGNDADVQAQLVTLTQALMDALVPGDADVWRRILADDAIIVDEFGRIQNKADAVASIHKFPEGLSGSIEIRAPKSSVHGDTAVLQGEMYERETVFGQQLVVRYIFSNTFVRERGAWKLIAATDVTLPTEPPPLTVADLTISDYPGSYSFGPGRAFSVAIAEGKLYYTTKAGGTHTALDPIAKDVFMSGGDERNLVIFRRNASGHVDELIERRKFNDLHMKRDDMAKKT
jgi:Domain of unknown function (DUF4440)